MAESIVNFVLGKLADATVQELLHLCGVDKQVKLVQNELGWIQAFLKDADRTNNSGDERQRHWVKEMRDVVYDIEDAIDKACLLGIEMENTQEKGPKKLPEPHELGDEIKEILERIKKISENREKYGTNNLGEGSGGQSELPIGRISISDFDDPDVVGCEHDIDNIIKELLDVNTKRRCVVSIVGTGGLGKTTLATKVYNSRDPKTRFHLRIWITVSRKFKLVDILRKLLQEAHGIDENEQGQDADYFTRELHKILLSKKYLLILDNVWDNNLSLLLKAFPNTKNGSRVLFTTRFFDIAKSSADPIREPYKLPYLTEQESLSLLLRKALPNQGSDKGYPNNLCDLAKEFIKRCGGLPLSLTLLGGLLSKRTPDAHSWIKVLEKMDWVDDASKVLATSYDDLPFALKSCFMYFALFSEDYKIPTKSLIRMWIAEGFIPHNDNKGALEDIAESFLEDLVQRSMVQVSKRYDNGSIEFCYIHDMLHDLAIRKAEEDNFLTVSSNPDDQKSCIGARRVALHHGKCDELMKDASSNLRSLFCFEEVPDISRHRQLKVLSYLREPWNDDDREKLWSEVSVSPSLRYLQLGVCTNYSIHFVGSNNLSFLQTIDLSGACSVEFPESVWHIKTLRHVLLPTWKQPPPGPPPLVHMTNLQTLGGVETRLSWEDEGFPDLPCLRELDIAVPELVHGLPWKVFLAFIGTLKRLKSLTIFGLGNSMERTLIREAFKDVEFKPILLGRTACIRL